MGSTNAMRLEIAFGKKHNALHTNMALDIYTTRRISFQVMITLVKTSLGVLVTFKSRYLFSVYNLLYMYMHSITCI